MISVKQRLKINYSSTLDPNRGIKIGTTKRKDFTLNPELAANPGPGQYDSTKKFETIDASPKKH